MSNKEVLAKGSWLGSVGCASQENGTAQCSAKNRVGPGWHSPWGTGCVLCDHLLQGFSSGDPVSHPLLRTGVCCGLSGRGSCPGTALQSPRGPWYRSTLPILIHYLLSFLLPFGVSVFPHTQIRAGILGSAFGDIPDRENIVSPQLRAVGLRWPRTFELTEL